MTRISSTSVDVLDWPILGRFLRWRRARTTLQLVLLAAAAIVVVHGIVGPQMAPTNLATVLTWVHYRGLLVLALLAGGNFFCTGCPFVLVRDVGRRALPPRARWPRVLRTKWVAIILFVAVLFAYELFDLWALPRATAYLVIGYFAAALAVDLTFAGATFCKYLCPIGQFNFAASTVSPLEIRIRERDTCSRCATADCIRGRRERAPLGLAAASAVPPASPVPARERLLVAPVPARERPLVAPVGPAPMQTPPIVQRQRGCELGLFLPMKVGNLDCTFCLDCVQACPHDNIALALRVPGAELVDARRRSGIGRLSRRPDIAALAVVFAFGGLVNAFGMTAPAVQIERTVSGLIGAGREAPTLAALFVVGLGLIPAALVAGAAAAARALSRSSSPSMVRTMIEYSYALVPFGAGMWLAHYLFHLLTGALAVVPVTQSAAADLFGFPVLGDPWWRWTGMRPASVFPIQVGFVLLGAIGSAVVAHQISERDRGERALAATLPWFGVVLLLAAAAIWILLQPMEMRGLGYTG